MENSARYLVPSSASSMSGLWLTGMHGTMRPGIPDAGVEPVQLLLGLLGQEPVLQIKQRAAVLQQLIRIGVFVHWSFSLSILFYESIIYVSLRRM
jgi:hypothetical protein